MLTVIDGSEIYYASGDVEWRAGQPTLCFVHGAGMDHTVWTLYSRYFARQGYNVLAPDLCGHRRSRGLPLTSIEAMSKWLHNLLDHLEVSEVALIGHSMGSLVALDTAAMLQQRCSHLMLLGTAVPMAVGDALIDAAHDNKQSARDMITIFGHAYSARLGGNPVAGIHVLNAALALLAQSGEGVLYTDLKACRDYTAGLEAAQSVTAHCGLILAEQDRMTPAKKAADLIKLLPAAEVITLENCGHMMMAEQPEATLQAMRKLLSAG